MAAALTLGAEEELHLIDLETWQLSARAPQVLSRLPRDQFSAEIQRTTVETNTAVVETLGGLREELLRLRAMVVEVAAREGLGIAAVGTAPRSDFRDFELTASGRYGRMQEQYRLLVDEQLICGTQVHVGVADRDLAVDIAQRVAPDLPALLALSASSPYWNGHDTGYSSIRTTIWQRWPTAGATGPLASAAEYDALLADLIGSGVIADAKMAYFDVRPSAHAPTLELRVCDACPLVDDAVLIAGLFRALVREAEIAVEAGRPRLDRPAPLHRAAIWQAARGGLRGQLLDRSAQGPRPVPAADVVRALVGRLAPVLEELGDAEEVTELAERALARGNSADRQRAALAETGRLDDVVRLVVEETHGPAGGQTQPGPVLERYAVRAGDEAVAPSAQLRPLYRPVIEAVRALGEEELRRRERARDTWAQRRQLGFRVGGVVRPFVVDLVPRVLGRHEWSQLRDGLEQRAVALERFLRDVYGEQRVITDGVVPRDAVVGAPGWREEALRLPPGAVRAAVMGFDLVRGEDGGWRVLEDNLRDPSGAAFAVAARELLDDVVADVPRPEGLAQPAAYYEQLRATLLAGARPGTRAALLSSGPGSGAWFEHQGLADGAGLLLVGADDLEVVDGRVRARRAGGDGSRGGAGTGSRAEHVGALHLRLDGHLADLVDSTGRAVGRELLEVAAAGGVVLANAPGNGVADDKAVYRAVPELISYYLDERPLLEQVPTYLLADEVERRAVLERVGELVTKPVDGHGGAGVMIGPAASAAEVAARRAEVAADPEHWVAQELVQLSCLPTLVNGVLVPRHVDLRVFAHVTGSGRGDARVADLALTRVAPADALVVNSSRGGGAKDTWLVVSEVGEEDTR